VLCSAGDIDLKATQVSGENIMRRFRHIILFVLNVFIAVIGCDGAAFAEYKETILHVFSLETGGAPFGGPVLMAQQEHFMVGR
jgi:hypothetical protein